MSDSSSILKMICFITDYEYWDDKINENATLFFKTYSIYPNILIASKSTWEKIDEFANQNNPNLIQNPDEPIYVIDDGEEIKSISTFVASEYSLEFCLDNKVSENSFILVFDEDPTFDGEFVEDSENKDEVIYKRIA